MIHRSLKAFAGYLLCGSLVFSQSPAQNPVGETRSLVVPSGVSTSYGDRSFDPLFFTSGPEVTQLYRASEFLSGAAQPVWINALAFRVEELSGGTPSLDVVVPRIRLTMSIFPGSTGDYDPRNPITLNKEVVFEQEDVHLYGLRPASPSQFAIRFSLATPYLYDPRLGALVLGIQSRQPGGNGADVDSQLSTSGRLIYYEPGGIIVSRAEVMVTQFSYSVVPEPRVSMLFIFGVAVSAAFYRRRLV